MPVPISGPKALRREGPTEKSANLVARMAWTLAGEAVRRVGVDDPREKMRLVGPRRLKRGVMTVSRKSAPVTYKIWRCDQKY